MCLLRKSKQKSKISQIIAATLGAYLLLRLRLCICVWKNKKVNMHAVLSVGICLLSIYLIKWAGRRADRKTCSQIIHIPLTLEGSDQSRESEIILYKGQRLWEFYHLKQSHWPFRWHRQPFSNLPNMITRCRHRALCHLKAQSAWHAKL